MGGRKGERREGAYISVIGDDTLCACAVVSSRRLDDGLCSIAPINRIATPGSIAILKVLLIRDLHGV